MASRDRAVTLRLQLRRAHEELRRQIRTLRADLGRRRTDDRVLVTHCLAFCGALTTHHQQEDTDIFAELVTQRPDLAGAVAKLVEDHQMIAAILSRMVDLAAQANGSRGSALAAIARELDGLAAIMESHFNYEERVITG